MAENASAVTIEVDGSKAEMTLIAWLADAAEALRRYGAPVVTIDSPVIPAAVDWLQASLTISEIQYRNMAPPNTGPAAGGVSEWADLGI